MKISKFNIYREEQENLFIYNTMSGGVLHLNADYKKNTKN